MKSDLASNFLLMLLSAWVLTMHCFPRSFAHVHGVQGAEEVAGLAAVTSGITIRAATKPRTPSPAVQLVLVTNEVHEVSVVVHPNPNVEQPQPGPPSACTEFTFALPHTICCDKASSKLPKLEGASGDFNRKEQRKKIEHQEDAQLTETDITTSFEPDEDWLPGTEEFPNSSEYLSDSDNKSFSVTSISNERSSDHGPVLHRSQEKVSK